MQIILQKLVETPSGLNPDNSKVFSGAMALLTAGYDYVSHGDMEKGLQKLEAGVESLQTIRPQQLPAYNIANKIKVGGLLTQPLPSNPSNSLLLVIDENARRARNTIKKIRGKIGEGNSLEIISPNPSKSIVQAQAKIKEKETLKADKDKRTDRVSASQGETNILVDLNKRFIPLLKNPEPEVILFIISLTDDNLSLNNYELNLLLSISCNEGFGEKLSLQNIEYNNIPKFNDMDEDILKSAIYGQNIDRHSTSAICSGLTMYFRRGLTESFKDWYQLCERVDRPDFVEQYLFGHSSDNRKQRFPTIKKSTETFAKKAKDDNVITDSEYNFLISLLNLESDKKALTKIKKAIGDKETIRNKLTALSQKLQRNYGVLPERIKIGPLSKHLKTRNSSPEQLQVESGGILKIASWFELPKDVITAYLISKEEEYI